MSREECALAGSGKFSGAGAEEGCDRHRESQEKQQGSSQASKESRGTARRKFDHRLRANGTGPRASNNGVATVDSEGQGLAKERRLQLRYGHEMRFRRIVSNAR